MALQAQMLMNHPAAPHFQRPESLVGIGLIELTVRCLQITSSLMVDGHSAFRATGRSPNHGFAGLPTKMRTLF